ncbi:unnamed protein product [Orchesella dallaii]|uniref:Fibronectin type-III domain-containing protein n=1 Tax=Orchesella dallaii TaxID=48710 RepID=A0ABP1QEG0_9HEXA
MIDILHNILYYLNLAAVLHFQENSTQSFMNISSTSAVSDLSLTTTTENTIANIAEEVHPLLVKQIPPGIIIPGAVVKFVCSFESDCTGEGENGNKLFYQWEMYRYTEDKDGKLSNQSASVIKLPSQGKNNNLVPGSLGGSCHLAISYYNKDYNFIDAEMEIEFNESVADPKLHCDLVCSTRSNSIPSSASIKLYFHNKDDERPELEPPTGFTMLGITSRTIYFAWNPPKMKTRNGIKQDLQITSYVIEYKNGRGMFDWKNGKVAVHEIVDGSAQATCISNLSPWTTYNFRIYARSNNITSPPSVPIIALTSEDLPSGPPTNIRVKVVNGNTLQVSWKPPPRSTWNGALLGYNVGLQKASSSDEEDYDIHMYTPMESFGNNPYTYHLTVSDSSIKYKVVVQAFNNIGSGPFSSPVSQSIEK